ncbi:MAG: glycosyltransferase [Chloroflexi bacterium]|nr:glycosyltransferase [Chloroflexota bacterium]
MVLDIGCGIRPQGFFKPKLHIFCEPCSEYVNALQRRFWESPDVIILQTPAQQAVKMFPDKSVDSIFMLDFIEHLDKEEGKQVIADCERIARKQVVVFTPLGFVAQEYEAGESDAWGLHGSQWQIHKSGWLPEDFDESWTILASTTYHLVSAKGETFDPPAGAFWAIKNLQTGKPSLEKASDLPLVSIITPAYNRASYLEETIQSVLTQDYPNIEYIVLDDGSTDNTREVLERYSGRIIWETHPNMGETRTVNKGFGLAKGEIIAVVNSDDPLLPGAVSTAVGFMQLNKDILVAYPDWNYIDSNSVTMGHMRVPEYDHLYMLKRHHCSVGPGAFICRKALDLAGMRDPDFKYVGDFEFWLRLGLYGKFARIPRTLATFRVHPDSASVAAKGKAMADEHIRMIRKFYSRPDLPPEVIGVRAEAFSWAHWVAGLAAGSSRWAALWHYIKAAAYHPRSLRKNFHRWPVAVSTLAPRPVFAVMQWGWHLVRPMIIKLRSFVRRSSRLQETENDNG